VERTIPSLATITDAHPIPGSVSVKNFDTTGNFENRALGCAFWRKYKSINILGQRQPRNLCISTQQCTNLGRPLMENFPQIFQRDSEASWLIHLRQAVIQLRDLGIDCRQLSQQAWRVADRSDGFGHVGRLRLQFLTLALGRQNPFAALPA
jgi:hypothetical protein